MKAQYSDASLSLQQVYEWSTMFRNGVRFLTHPPGQPHRVVTPASNTAVEHIMMGSGRVAVNATAVFLGIIHGSAHHIIHHVF
jgi:hypothetical protein